MYITGKLLNKCKAMNNDKVFQEYLVVLTVSNHIIITNISMNVFF